MRRIPLEWRLAGLVLVGAVPPIGLLLASAFIPISTWALWTTAGGTLVLAGFIALAVHRRAARGFERVTGLVHSVRDGEYGLRARAETGSFGRTLASVNALAQDLAGMQRAGIESDALLGKLLSALNVAIFVFDPSGRLNGANHAAMRLLGRDGAALNGSSAESLGLADWLEADATRRERRRFSGGDGPWEVRITRFRRGGKPHRLLVVTDLSKALREEERRAWRSLIRVLAHETSNSLGPIQSTADALSRRLKRAELAVEAEQAIGSGLELIERRAKSLSDFIHRYAELARLPDPRPASLDLGTLLCRVASLETRVQVVTAGPEHVPARADGAQIEHALINLLKNATDAALETGGEVRMQWSEHAAGALIEILDSGPGLPESENLFVPFFTTKPGGSGIGLVLARQIIEGHGGTITLENRTDTLGTVARVRLPFGAAP